MPSLLWFVFCCTAIAERSHESSAEADVIAFVQLRAKFEAPAVESDAWWPWSHSKKHEAPAPCDPDGSAIQALVINLPSMTERWRTFSENFASSVERGCLTTERMDAVDGNSINGSVESKNVVETWNTSHNAGYVHKKWLNNDYKVQELPMTTGERGCAMSHILAWREVAQRGRPMLILEDDAMPVEGFAERFRVAMSGIKDRSPNADILYLAYDQAAPWRARLATIADPYENGCLRIEEAEYLWTTAGYVLWPSGASVLLASLPVDGPVDDFIAWQMASRKLKGYAVSPALLNQDRDWGVDSTIQHSDELVTRPSEQPLAFACDE